MQSTGTRPKLAVSRGGRGVVGHAGTRLLADIAEVSGLSRGFAEALGGLRQRRPVHEPGRVAVDVAVVLAGGGEAISDLGVLRHQPALFGPVASDATAWRVLDGLDAAALSRLGQARAAAREVAWAQMGETRGGIPASKAAGFDVPGLVLDMDATLVICHSEKESATRTWKKTFGFHPLLLSTRGQQRGLRVFDHGAVDDVSEAPFQAAHGFLVGFACGSFALVVVPAWGRSFDLGPWP